MSGPAHKEVQRILFITLSCVGDVVMSTPVLQALHRRYPGARVDIVADRRASLLLSRCPWRGDILHKDKQALLRGGLELVLRLWRRRYDLIIDLRTDGLSRLLRGEARLTNKQARPYGPHSVERMMGVIHSLHGEAPLPPACVWLNESDRQYAAARLACLPPGPWLALGPGSAGARERKYWPEEHYAALANASADRFNGVILVGGPGEEPLVDAIAEQLSLPYVDITDADLLGAAAVLERAALFVGSDSGPGHMAAAVGVPTVTLFGEDHRVSCLPWGGRAVGLLAASGYARDIPLDEVHRAVQDRLPG